MNNHRFFSKYILFIVPAIIAISCEQNMDIEIKTNDKRLLVDGEFTNDSTIHTIKLYCPGSLITGQPQTVVSGAKIFVTDKVDTIYYIESDSTPGLYLTSGKCRGTGGRTYTLLISNIDIDNDGKMDFYTSESVMRVPVKMDSLSSKRGLHPNDRIPGINNIAYFKIPFNGPDYIYKFLSINKEIDMTITDLLGSGGISRFEKEYKMPKVNTPGTTMDHGAFLFTEKNVVNGDTIEFIIYNFTKEQFEFLKEFDNNTNGDPFWDNIYDQLKIPFNLPTNIEPSDKAAGYFFVYSVSRISKVFKE